MTAKGVAIRQFRERSRVDKEPVFAIKVPHGIQCPDVLVMVRHAPTIRTASDNKYRDIIADI